MSWTSGGLPLSDASNDLLNRIADLTESEEDRLNRTWEEAPADFERTAKVWAERYPKEFAGVQRATARAWCPGLTEPLLPHLWPAVWIPVLATELYEIRSMPSAVYHYLTEPWRRAIAADADRLAGPRGRGWRLRSYAPQTTEAILYG